MPRLSMEDLKSRKIKQQESTGGMPAKASSILLLVIFLAFTRPKLSKEGKDRVLQALHHKDHHYTNFIQLELLVFHYFGPEPNQKVLSLKLSNQRNDEWIAAEESPNEPNKEWPSVFHRDAQEEDENGDKDKEVHNLSDCELENEVRDFDDLPMDLDERNDIYDEGLPLEDNIHQINDDFGF
uniref:Uncharacterized protein n=1 Tax=Fagus sylvatica TaxID=28930 RepID=A0A2N9FZG0_FAGSY